MTHLAEEDQIIDLKVAFEESLEYLKEGEYERVF